MTAAGGSIPTACGWFADYAAVAFRALGDRVPMWTTLNEPWVVVDAGYLHGVNAPGHRNVFEAPLAMHHLLHAHTAAVRVYRSGPWKGQIGLVVNIEPKEPATDSRRTCPPRSGPTCTTMLGIWTRSSLAAIRTAWRKCSARPAGVRRRHSWRRSGNRSTSWA